MSSDLFSTKPKQASESAFDFTRSNTTESEWSSLRLFPADYTPMLRPFYTFTFTIKISTHTCIRKNNFVCTTIAHNIVLVQLVFDRSLSAGAYQRLHSSKVKSGGCAVRMPICSCTIERSERVSLANLHN